ncbi:MAG: alpha/beta fold hydrolase [Actinomycetota bacterium]
MTEIVLVHGAWHGPWCWSQVADALDQRGHRVHAVTLPGHDQPGRRTRIWSTIRSAVEAVGDAVAACDSRPLLVGHSMGGYVAQRYLERNHDVSGAVLVASVPASGALSANLRTLRHHPGRTIKAMLTADYMGLVDDPALVRELFFTPETPDATVLETAAELQNESALAINTMVLRRPRPGRVTVPVHVIAAEADAIFTLGEQRALATAYGADLVVLPGGHDIMLDTDWAALVDAVHRVAEPGA